MNSVAAELDVPAAAPVVMGASTVRRRYRLTLRTKGMLALGLMCLFIAGTAWFLAGQRQQMIAIIQQIDSHRTLQGMLAPSFNTLAHTLVETQAILSSPEFSDGENPRYAQIAANLDPLMERLEKMRGMDAVLTRNVVELRAAVEAVRADASGRNLTRVRDAEQQLIANLDDILSSLERQSEVLTRQYRDKQQLISITALGTSVLGALATAAVILVFFTRLARDIERLQGRAAAIVDGYSGEPLENDRHDEIGGLIDAVNQMQSDLRRVERQQELSRQQRFHQEKMAAIGSMSAAVGHEVSNPIAAIAGVAQFLIDETRDESNPKARLAHDFAGQILQQTERIATIIRQLGTLTRHHSPEPELLNLNELVQSTCGFIGYDKRFRGIEFEIELDHELPAVTAVADHLTQVLMNLLINAADAMEDVPKDGQARIRVATQRNADEIWLAVTDTGHGMTDEVLARAFEESFTTKPAGRGRGIGLFLCKTLIEQAGGRINLASTVGVGTTINLYLPLQPRGTGRA